MARRENFKSILAEFSTGVSVVRSLETTTQMTEMCTWIP